LGLEAAINRLIEFWTSRRPTLRIHAQVPEDGISPELDPVIYRIVQESTSNAVRHGNTNVIDIVVERDPVKGVRVSVSDDGGGLKSTRAGHGLTGMRERVAARLGVFAIGNRLDGKGVLVEASFPANAERSETSAFMGAGPAIL
jgi:two-component system sensor histidine kinase UhpB